MPTAVVEKEGKKHLGDATKRRIKESNGVVMKNMRSKGTRQEEQENWGAGRGLIKQ